jgi:hypothetical protein
MHVFLWLGVLVPVVVAGEGPAMAAPAVDLGAREREIDDAVCEDFDRAAKWNLTWTATFAVAAVGSAGTAALSSQSLGCLLSGNNIVDFDESDPAGYCVSGNTQTEIQLNPDLTGLSMVATFQRSP